LYIRNSLCKGVSVVRNHFDTIIWLKLDTLFFNFTDDVYIAGVYMWVEGPPAYNVVNEDLFDIDMPQHIIVDITKLYLPGSSLEVFYIIFSHWCLCLG